MRWSGLLLLSATWACDGQVTVDGVVVDEQGAAVADADVALSDRVFDDELDAFLSGETNTPPQSSISDENGEFYDSTIVAGGGEHDIWLVVSKSGFLTHSEQLWSGDGVHSEDFHLTVELQSE